MTQVKRRLLASGMLFDGRQFDIVHAEHDRELKGVGYESFAVDVHGRDSLPGGSYGFVNEGDARKFVSTLGNVKVTSHDDYGDEVEDVRQGLGVPSAMISNVSREDSPNSNEDNTAKGPGGK